MASTTAAGGVLVIGGRTYERQDAQQAIPSPNIWQLVKKVRFENTLRQLLGRVGPSCEENKYGLVDYLKKELGELGATFYMDDSAERARQNKVTCEMSAGQALTPTVGNLIAKVPASVSGRPSINISMHMDCQAFSRPITLETVGDIVRTVGGTQMCSDNQLGIAETLEILKVLKENNIPHGEINLMFAWGEEAGVFGVQNSSPDYFVGDVFFILDGDSKMLVRGTGDIRFGTATIEAAKSAAIAAKVLVAMGATPSRTLKDDSSTVMNIGYLTGGIPAENNWLSANANIIPDATFLTFTSLTDEESDALLLSAGKKGAAATFQTNSLTGAGQLFIKGVVKHPALIDEGGLNSCHVGALLMSENADLQSKLVDFQCGSAGSSAPAGFVETSSADKKTFAWQMRTPALEQSQAYVDAMKASLEDICKTTNAKCEWSENMYLHGYNIPADSPPIVMFKNAAAATGIAISEPNILLGGSNGNYIYPMTGRKPVLIIPTGQNETEYNTSEAYDSLYLLGGLMLETARWQRK